MPSSPSAGDQRLEREEAGRTRPGSDDVAGLEALGHLRGRRPLGLLVGDRPVEEAAVAVRRLPGAHRRSRLSGATTPRWPMLPRRPRPGSSGPPPRAMAVWAGAQTQRRGPALPAGRRLGAGPHRAPRRAVLGPAGPTARGRSRRARSTGGGPRHRGARVRRGTGQPAADRAWTDLGEVVQSGGKRVQAWAVEGDLDVTASRAARSRPSGHRARGGARSSPRSTGPVVPARGRRPQAGAGAVSPRRAPARPAGPGRGRRADRPPDSPPGGRPPAKPATASASASRSRPEGASITCSRTPRQMGRVRLLEQGEAGLVGQHGQESPLVRGALGPLDQPRRSSPSTTRLIADSDMAPREASSLIRSDGRGPPRGSPGRSTRSCHPWLTWSSASSTRGTTMKARARARQARSSPRA